MFVLTKEMKKKKSEHRCTVSRLRFVIVLKGKGQHLALHLERDFVIVSKKALFCLDKISSNMSAEAKTRLKLELVVVVAKRSFAESDQGEWGWGVY